MTWQEAIKRVLEDSGASLHYSDIYREIVRRGYKRGGSDVSVNSIINTEIRKGAHSIFERVEIGTYGLKTEVHPARVKDPTPEIDGNGQGQHQVPNRPRIYLFDNQLYGGAITVRETQHATRNNGWICIAHGSLDFKNPNAPGLTRYLIGEIAQLGGNVLGEPGWLVSGGGTCAGGVQDPGATACMGGLNYQGGIRNMGTWQNAVSYLKHFYTVIVAHAGANINQAAVDAL